MCHPRCLCTLALVLLTTGTWGQRIVRAGEVDLTLSRIYVFVDKTGAGHQHAIEGKLSKGKLDLNLAQNAGSLTFDLPSFSADTAAARKALRLPGETDAGTRSQVTANMLGAAVLDTGKFPTAEFVVHKAQELPFDPNEAGQRHYQLEGELELHGVKRPVQLKVSVAAIDRMIRIRGMVDLKQTDFGIKPFTKLLGAVGVADDVRVFGEIWTKP